MPRGLSNIPTDKIMFSEAEEVLEITSGPNGQGWFVGLCPAHFDEHPSLAILEADDGSLIVHCYAGCEPKEIYIAVRALLKEE